MVQLDDLSVGTVAGLIAAGVFIVQFAIPTLFPLLLVGVLGKENNAVTWSVVGRTLHASHWPTILRSDTAANSGVRGSVQWLGILQRLTLLLITVASIVTPLGLYEAIVPSKQPEEQIFQYAKDLSQFGMGTLPRNPDLGLSRVCGGFTMDVCPWSDTILIETRNSTTYTADLPEGYNTRIPKNITEIYTSGFSKFNNTVATMFDINWRTYRKVVQSLILKENDTYLVGDYRHLQSVLLNDAQEAYEGLIVDTKVDKPNESVGGIGFRNHTLPPAIPFGSTWTEDLLFIEPETQCVDTNLTIDFSIPRDSKNLDAAENVVLTDRGGFANFNKEIPWYDTNKTFESPYLRERAYFAAWFTNVYVMFYFNVTNPKTKDGPRFQYLESQVGKTFPIKVRNGSFSGWEPRYDQLVTTQVFGEFAMVPGNEFNGSVSNSSSRVSEYANPFQISKANFTDIGEACSGSNGRYNANISNIAVACGMVYGAARRRDGSASLFFDPGTEWTVPIYTCASASKASIKTVSFRYNGTAGLSSLDIVDIKPKQYAKNEDKPLWAVENLSLRLQNANPVWGMTTPESASGPNISTTQHEYLYLPGYSAMGALSAGPVSKSQNLAGVDFYHSAMAQAYDIDAQSSSASVSGVPDYSGKTNLALYSTWQGYSRDEGNVSKIVNLVWTDLVSNSVVGTKGHLPAAPLRNLQERDGEGATAEARVPVTTYHRRIRFHIRYGIPAFVVVVLFAVFGFLGFGMMVIGRASPSKMRLYLDSTSAGRLMTAFLFPNEYPVPGAPTRTWIRGVGRKSVVVGGVRPMGRDHHGAAVQVPGTSHSNYSGNQGFQQGLLGGKEDAYSISMQNLPSPQAYSPMNNGGGVPQQGLYVGVPPGSATSLADGYGYGGSQNGGSQAGQPGYGSGGYR